MKRGYLLYVRYSPNWTRVYGPSATMNRHAAMKPYKVDQRDLDDLKEDPPEAWWVKVAVDDKEKLL